MSPHVFFQGFVLLHAGEEFVLILPVALLAGAFALIAWAGKGDTADQAAADGASTDGRDDLRGSR